MSRFDRWSRDGMPDDAANRVIQRGIDATMREIIRAPHIPRSASMIPDRQRAADETPRTVSAETPLRPPSGINYIDQMCEAQDRQDRLTAIRQANELAEIERRLDRGNPNRVKSSYDPIAEFDRSMPPLHRSDDRDND